MAAWDDILGASGPRVRFGQELEDYLSSKQIEGSEPVYRIRDKTRLQRISASKSQL
jgi:hypothetical protein